MMRKLGDSFDKSHPYRLIFGFSHCPDSALHQQSISFQLRWAALLAHKMYLASLITQSAVFRFSAWKLCPR